jgi:hypothetical protein
MQIFIPCIGLFLEKIESRRTAIQDRQTAEESYCKTKEKAHTAIATTCLDRRRKPGHGSVFALLNGGGTRTPLTARVCPVSFGVGYRKYQPKPTKAPHAKERHWPNPS